MSILTLKRVLLADAVTAAVVAVIGIADSAIVAPFLGLPAIIVSVAGWICLPTAILLGLLALQAQPSVRSWGSSSLEIWSGSPRASRSWRPFRDG